MTQTEKEPLEMQRKNITIRDDQATFIDQTHLNLSRFVQTQLDQLMKKRGYLTPKKR